MFPRMFDPRAMQGDRAKQFATSGPDDVFQSLVSDWLRTQSPQTQATPTDGADGRIDVFLPTLDPSRARSAPLEGAPDKLIVECKQHDPGRANWWDNVEAGWSKVHAALKAAQADGWSGLYAPWKTAKGYLYCLSVACPSVHRRQELLARITADLQALAPHIQWVQLADWADLKAACDASLRLRDDWLGMDNDALVPHATHVARLTGFRAYLSQDRLGFVAPPAAATAHPEQIFKRLQARPNERGVLLVGPGGVGKTRTALEVATLAAAQGWRVLHAAHGRTEIDAGTLAAAAVPGCQEEPVLLVLDYLEQMARLNLDEVRSRVLGAAQERGGRIAILALARPGAALRKDNDWKAFFDRQELAPEETQRTAIIAAMLAAVAPLACRHLGTDMLTQAVGSRPIIALLIAREIEQRVIAGQSLETLLRQTPSGDLATWLERRLWEDRIIPNPVPDQDSVLPRFTAPSDELLAVAAMVAAAPLAADELAAVADAILATPQGDALRDHLRRLGWLEADGAFLQAAHDVVTDELLRRCLIDPATDQLRPDCLAQVLTPGLTQVRVLGRHAEALTRAFADNAALAPRVSTAIAAWIAAQAAPLAAALDEARTDIASYALGAAVNTTLYQTGLLSQWDRLLAPWLARQGILHDARHLLGRALKSLPAPAPSLIAAALDWLNRHQTTPAASHILAPLLEREDVTGKAAQAAIAAAQAWLGHGTNGSSPEASHVLAPLLEREDVIGEDAQAAIAAAQAWLGHGTNGSSLEARFVLAPLLERKDVIGEDAQAAIAAAQAWLGHGTNGTSLEASHVLPPLLGRKDLGKDAQAAIAAAQAWLCHRLDDGTRQGLTPEAQFVLAPLLGREDVIGEDAQAAIAAAQAWLGHGTNGSSPEASHVLPPLLERKDIIGEAAQAAIAAALDWLDHGTNGDTVEASYLFPPLLRHGSIRPDQEERVIAAALDWLAGGPREARDASYVLKALLVRSTHWPVARAGWIDEAAVPWIMAHWRRPDADFITNRVLRRGHIADSLWSRVAARALWQVWQRGWKDDEAWTISGLLTRPDQLRRRSLRWLGRRWRELERAGKTASIPGHNRREDLLARIGADAP